MKSLFSDSAIEIIKKMKKGFLWAAVCILIGEVIVAAVLILVQSFDETIGKLMGTFGLCGLMLFLGVNNFSLMERKDRIVQSFALVSLIGNIVWLILSILFIWDAIPFFEKAGVDRYYDSYFNSYHMSVMAKVLMVAINIAMMCFLISNVWAIEETVKPVKPLKITAILCELYCGIYAAVVIVGEVQAVMDGRWYGLAGLAGFAFIVMACAAAIVSRNAKKKIEKGLSSGGGENPDTQAMVREMVEKEVQARMAAMQGGDVAASTNAAASANVAAGTTTTNAPSNPVTNVPSAQSAPSVQSTPSVSSASSVVGSPGVSSAQNVSNVSNVAVNTTVSADAGQGANDVPSDLVDAVRQQFGTNEEKSAQGLTQQNNQQ